MSLPHGRWLGDFKRLTAFERKLVRACAFGESCAPDNWDGKRPESSTPANKVRAEIVRFLALGGDELHPVHERGLMLRGAWVAGELNLYRAKLPFGLDLFSCHFESVPRLIAATLPELTLTGSCVPGLKADRMVVNGSVFLRDGFLATGEVRMLGAQIDDCLYCRKSHFFNPDGIALRADRLTVKGSVFLRDGFVAEGEVKLHAARIWGNLNCSKGKFVNSGERAINAEGMVVDGRLFLRQMEVGGAISLAAAKIGTLVDDAECWRIGGHVLDGLRYNRISGPTKAADRISWLERQRDSHVRDDFRPQPWEQLIRVLRDMGHTHEATNVAIAKQFAMRKSGTIGGGVRGAMHWLYGALADFGHRPMKLVGWMTLFWIISAFCFSIGGKDGYIGPSTPLLSSPELAAEVDRQCGFRGETGKQPWARCSAMPAEYTTFQPVLYSLDIILPLVDLQQEQDWAPIVESSPGVNLPYGVFLRWLMWAETLFGWLASLMLVAILGRLVERD